METTSTIQKQDQIVAVIGSGIYDAPLLELSNIGISFESSSAPTSKEASDITLLKDNLASAIEGILFGRHLYQVANMLVEAHFINYLSLFSILIFGAIAYGQWIFSLPQVIYLIIVCELFQSFILINVKPNIEILSKSHPISMNVPLLRTSKIFWASLFIFILVVLLLGNSNYLQYRLLTIPEYEDQQAAFWNYEHINSRHLTFVFNTYVASIIFTTLNIIIGGVFSNLLNNNICLQGFMVWIIVQLAIVIIGSMIYDNYSLTIQQQLLSYGLGSSVLIKEYLIKKILQHLK